MKLFFLPLFISLFTLQVCGQTISGAIKDQADGAPISYATIALLRPDSSIITGAMSNNEGRFDIKNVEAGDYLLQVSFIGYEQEYRNVHVPSQSNVGDIFLSEGTNILNEVIITGRRALVEQRLDRLVVNVSGNIITAGLNINDLLKQLPGLVVDQNGSIKLNGQPATVHIDGRPTRLPAEQVAQMLNGMMGDVVDRVELIENPSSRYEAGSSSAIVNIRLKRDATLGLNGTAQAGIGFTEHDLAYQGGLNLNYRSKKINLYANYGYSSIPRLSELFQTRNFSGIIPVTYDQYSQLHHFGPSHTLRAGIDWFITSKQTIGFIFNGVYNNRSGDISAKANIMQTGVSKIDSTELSDLRSNNKYSSQMYNLNYHLTIDDGEEITIDADYGNVYARNWQNMQSRYLDSGGNEIRSPFEYQYKGPRNIDILSLKIDYVKPLSEKSRIEAGIKTGKTITNNEIIYENLFNGNWEIDHNQSNKFKYTEQISAAYATFSYKFGKFSAMAGLRAEYTSNKGESPTMDTLFTRSYIDWFPSAYIQYQFNDKQMLNLSYSRKIDRPSYSLLNPFRTFYDPFTFQSGNPDLKPLYINSIGLRYSIKRYSVNLFYFIYNDIFTQDYIQDDATHAMGLIQKNLGKSQVWSLGVYVPIDFTRWYTLTFYTQFAWNKDDTYHSGNRFLNDFLTANSNLQQTFTIIPTMKVSMQFLWSKRAWEGISYFNDIWYMNAQIEKSFLDRRLSLILSCNDLFSSLVYSGKIHFGNINQTFKEDQNLRRIILTVRYNFGSQQIRGARYRSVGIDEEMGRTR